jgi:hypothetical protein
MVCLTCGRLLPHDDHGKVDYLTIQDLWKTAKIDDLSLDEAVAMLIKTVEVEKKEAEHVHH